MNRFTLLCAAAAIVAPASAYAQETTSSLRGSVSAGGAPVAGAEVTATHVPSGTVFNTNTGQDGNFQRSGNVRDCRHVPPGDLDQFGERAKWRRRVLDGAAQLQRDGCAGGQAPADQDACLGDRLAAELLDDVADNCRGSGIVDAPAAAGIDQAAFKLQTDQLVSAGSKEPCKIGVVEATLIFHGAPKEPGASMVLSRGAGPDRSPWW